MTSTTDLVRELMQMGREYGRDLLRMAAAEWKEQSRAVRTLAVLAGAAALLLAFSFLFLSLALIGAIAYGLGSWRWALLIVGAGYGLLGLLLLVPLAHGLQRGLLHFDHTRRRVREDAEWIKHKLAA